MATKRLQVEIGGDASGARKAFGELDDAAGGSESKLSAFGDKMGDIGKKLTLGVTLPIVGAGLVVGKWASDAAENANKVNVIFGENAATITAWSKNAETSFGLSEGQAQGFFGTVGTMLQGFGIDAAALPDMSQKVLQLGADLGSFHNLNTAEVMDMIGASFRGEYDSIQRLIPTINAAAVETKALAMTGKQSADQLTQQEKAMATYQLLLEGAGPATGDFARTQDGAANSMKIATAEVRSAGEQIGAVFMPIVAKVAGVVGEWADKFANLDDRTKTIIVVVAAAVAAIGPLAMAISAVTTVVGGLSAAMTFLAANPIVLIIAAVVALVAGLVWAYNNVDWFRNAVQAAWQAISAAVQWAWDNVLKPIWDAIYGFVSTYLIPIIQAYWQVYVQVWEAIAAVVSWAWDNVIKPVWDAIYGFVQDWLIPAAKQWWEVMQQVWGGISAAISWAWNNVIKPNWDAMQSVLNNVLIPAFNTAKAVVSAVWEGISSAIRTAWGGIQTVFGWLTSAIDGIKAAFSSIADIVTSVFNGLLAPIRSAIDGVKNFWNNNIAGKGSFKVPFTDIGFDGIPRLHTGGVFRAAIPGGEGLALLRDGERVDPSPSSMMPTMVAASSGGNVTQNITIVQQPGEDVDALVERLDAWARRNGRLAFGVR